MFDFLRNIFARPTPEQKVQSLEFKDLPPDISVPEPSVPSTDSFHFTIQEATQLALKISSSFESHDGFASVVGNFDGEGLTCGALGFTWKFGRMQKLMLQCEAKHPGVLSKYMPIHGKTFLAYASMSVVDSFSHISVMTDVHGEVFPRIKTELQAFWGSPEMVEIQVGEASQMAKLAMREASLWSEESRKVVSPTLHEFCFMFDIVVQNGSLMGLNYQSVKEFIAGGASLQIALAFCEHNSNSDAKRNAILWSKIFPNANPDQQKLFILGFMRAEKSNQHYSGSVLDRKGTLALMQGYVNEQLKNFYQEYPSLLNDIVK